MTQLFAAVDAQGEIRFVGDVPRGAACGCFCPVCNSPLVAKQGEVNEWHFAHEGQQERVECAAGAVNLLRRLALESLRTRSMWVPEPMRMRVRARTGEAVSEVVEWNRAVLRKWQWHMPGARQEAVADGELSNGAPVKLFIEVSQERPHYAPSPQLGTASLVFWVYMPSMETLRHMASARAFVEKNGVLVWKNLPDTQGLIAAAQARLDAEGNERAAAIRAKWEQFDNQLVGRQIPGHTFQRPVFAPWAPVITPKPEPKPKAAPKALPWAPGQVPGSMLNFYRLKDGSAWVVYRREGGGLGIAPWGELEDGWDEALPPSVGTADPDLCVYIARDQASPFLYFGPRSKTSRNDADPAAFEGL